MDYVKSAKQVHFDVVLHELINFECNNAKETEGLQCDREIVRQAILDIYSDSEKGHYFLYMNPLDENEVCGSALVTFEDQKTWWIQSVYVSDRHRRKGIFSSLFDKILEVAKENGVEKLKLCVCKNNERAKKAYKKVGMYQNDLQFTGIDLVYGETIQMNMEIPYEFEIEEVQQDEPLPELHQFMGIPVKGRDSLICFYMNQVIGWCQYVYQFDVWRGSTVFTITTIFSKPEFTKKLVDYFPKFLLQQHQNVVGGVRYMGNEEQLRKIERIQPNSSNNGYNIMEIQI